MISLNELINRQLTEKTELDKAQQLEKNNLKLALEKDLKVKVGNSHELNMKYEKARFDLHQEHLKQAQKLWDKHQNEHKEREHIKQQLKPLEEQKILERRTEENLKMAEERENHKKIEEALEKQRQSLLDKIKEKLQKSRDRERER